MEKAKFKWRILKTVEEVEEGAMIYFEISRKENPFLLALGLSSREIYEQIFKPKVPAIVEQQLSVGAFLQDTGEMIACILAVDALTKFDIKPANRLLRAQEAFFAEGKARMFQEQELTVRPKFGEYAEALLGVTKPAYMNLNVGKYVEGGLFKVHFDRGYKYQYGECIVPRSHYLWETLDVPYMSMRLFYRDFEYEDEKIFENLEFGKEYRYDKPCCLFYIISIESMIDAGVRVMKRKMEKMKAKL